MLERKTLTVEEFAALVGIGRNTCYEAARRGTLPVPVIKVGRRLVIPRHEVEKLLTVSLKVQREEASS